MLKSESKVRTGLSAYNSANLTKQASVKDIGTSEYLSRSHATWFM